MFTVEIEEAYPGLSNGDAMLHKVIRDSLVLVETFRCPGICGVWLGFLECPSAFGGNEVFGRTTSQFVVLVVAFADEALGFENLEFVLDSLVTVFVER